MKIDKPVDWALIWRKAMQEAFYIRSAMYMIPSRLWPMGKFTLDRGDWFLS